MRIFFFTTAFGPALGPTQPPIKWVPSALSLGVKRPGREADHSPPSSAEVKGVELYLHSPIRLYGAVLSYLTGFNRNRSNIPNSICQFIARSRHKQRVPWNCDIFILHWHSEVPKHKLDWHEQTTHSMRHMPIGQKPRLLFTVILYTPALNKSIRRSGHNITGQGH
jgi:hypothetical protein